MNHPYRKPQVEEGIRNIILQNRAGLRVTLLFHGDRTDLEFVYKPNAFRRKDFRARNFSSRDNFTTLFAHSALPDINAGMVKTWGYDPFVTRLETMSDSLARNAIIVVNLPDENAFVLAARQPLLLTLRPHQAFDLQDGLLWEKFSDRGEEIVSFVAFDSLENNRYRVLDDGRHVLQLIENDVLLIGGEENTGQVQRIIRKFARWTLPQCISHTERTIKPVLDHARISVANDPDLQRVLDINKRLLWSNLDEGGACTGAMNRIYHLIWVRDGAMAAATMARAGCLDPVRIWTPFLLANPSVLRDEAGNVKKEFSQLVGSRWSKGEDDGIYYAFLSLYALVQTTGDDTLLAAGVLPELLDNLDGTITSRFNPEIGLFGSDVLGEDCLADNPYYGYDVVSGELVNSHHRPKDNGPTMTSAYTLYQNINMYNCLRMAQLLIDRNGDAGQSSRAASYAALARQMESTLAERFVNAQGFYRAAMLAYSDGHTEWTDFAPRQDFWEYSWAVSTGPFHPDPAISLASARQAVAVWPTITNYGYCPWNFLARYLKEYGLPSAAYRQLLDQEIREALMLTQKYPMAGLVTEYQTSVEGWRGLPFQIGSLYQSVCANLLQPLAQGIAVRAGDVVDRVGNFQYRDRRIDAQADGQGDIVQSILLNGCPLVGTLQIPEDRLQSGHNRLKVTRGAAFTGARLFSSDAILRRVTAGDKTITYELASPFDAQLIFSGLTRKNVHWVRQSDGKELPITIAPLADTDLSILRVQSTGEFVVCIEAHA